MRRRPQEVLGRCSTSRQLERKLAPGSSIVDADVDRIPSAEMERDRPPPERRPHEVLGRRVLGVAPSDDAPTSVRAAGLLSCGRAGAFSGFSSVELGSATELLRGGAATGAGVGAALTDLLDVLLEPTLLARVSHDLEELSLLLRFEPLFALRSSLRPLEISASSLNRRMPSAPRRAIRPRSDHRKSA